MATSSAPGRPTGKIGLLWRGDRRAQAMNPKAEARLGPLFSALSELGVAAEGVVFADDAVDEVRVQLLGLDGVLVWVNPIQDGADRGALDALLREAAGRGVWVSAHPDVILAMGTKEVLFRTRSLGWGTDTDWYGSFDELSTRFPNRLRRDGVRVLKQGRGNGGNGVWKVELIDSDRGPDVAPRPDAAVRVQHAQDRDGTSEQTTLGAFLERCPGYFTRSGGVIDQPFVDRLADGLVRCYLVHDEVVGYCHQRPKGFLDPSLDADSLPPARAAMEPADALAYQRLRTQAEREWIPQMRELLGLATEQLPVIWDADFLYGPRTDAGEDTYVLCEINVSAVWPYPPDATPKVARAAVARMSGRRARR